MDRTRQIWGLARARARCASAAELAHQHAASHALSPAGTVSSPPAVLEIVVEDSHAAVGDLVHTVVGHARPPFELTVQLPSTRPGGQGFGSKNRYCPDLLALEFDIGHFEGSGCDRGGTLLRQLVCELVGEDVPLASLAASLLFAPLRLNVANTCGAFSSFATRSASPYAC